MSKIPIPEAIKRKQIRDALKSAEVTTQDIKLLLREVLPIKGELQVKVTLLQSEGLTWFAILLRPKGELFVEGFQQ